MSRLTQVRQLPVCHQFATGSNNSGASIIVTFWRFPCLTNIKKIIIIIIIISSSSSNSIIFIVLSKSYIPIYIYRR